MIKVFLVEDEVIIRNGIKNNINWEEYGMEFSGEASDGELAYPLIKKAKPDILVTDIKMPFMDGLELSKLVKRELPNTRIVVLSGYNDFDYAKEAISIGVTEYLLKPISADKLLKSLMEIGQSIEEEKRTKDNKDSTSKYEDNIIFEKTEFFNRIMIENYSMGEMIEEGIKYGINFGNGAYNVLLFKISSKEKNDSNKEMKTAAAEIEGIEKLEPEVLVCRRGVEGWAILMTGEDDEKVWALSTTIKNRLLEIMSHHTGLNFFGGIGNPVLRTSEIKSAFSAADRLFALRFAGEGNQILSKDDVNDVNNTDMSIASLGSVDQIRTMIQNFLSKGTLDELESFVDMFFERIPADNRNSILMRQYLLMDIYINAVSFVEKMNGNIDAYQSELEELKRGIQDSTTARKMKKYIAEVLEKSLEIRDQFSVKRYGEMIEEAKEYIKKEYMSEEISLNSVSAEVGMSASYFSSIFSKEVGQTFVEYLTSIRMEKAKELLMCSAMKTSEIAYEVGYKDSHYFSYIFKKTQNCSPKEYRSRRKM